MFNFVGYQYDLAHARSGQAYPGEVGGPDLQDRIPSVQNRLLNETTHVLDRPAHGNRETGAFQTCAYETHSVASEEPLAYPRVTGKDNCSQYTLSISYPNLLITISNC